MLEMQQSLELPIVCGRFFLRSIQLNIHSTISHSFDAFLCPNRRCARDSERAPAIPFIWFSLVSFRFLFRSFEFIPKLYCHTLPRNNNVRISWALLGCIAGDIYYTFIMRVRAFPLRPNLYRYFCFYVLMLLQTKLNEANGSNETSERERNIQIIIIIYKCV